MEYSSILSLVGLVIEIIGAFLIYKFSPDNDSGDLGRNASSFGISDREAKRRNFMMLLGFLGLGIGFVLQAVGILINEDIIKIALLAI